MSPSLRQTKMGLRDSALFARRKSLQSISCTLHAVGHPVIGMQGFKVDGPALRQFVVGELINKHKQELINKKSHSSFRSLNG